MVTKKLAAGLAVAGLGLCLAAPSNAQAGMDKMFMTKAAQGGMAEVMTSRLALKKTHNAQVRMVAARMVKEHSAANKELMGVAMRKHVMLPRDTDAKHKAMYAKLSGMRGMAFDKAYMAGQEKDHAATVALFKKEIAMGKDKDASAFAAKNLPTIEDHTKMIFQVGGSLGVMAAPMPALKPAMMPSSMKKM